MKVAILGQAPNRTGDPSLVLEGEPLRSRLIDVLGCTEDEWRKIIKVNALTRWPGRSPGGKGDRFPLLEARLRVDAIRPVFHGHLVFVLGRHAARALRFERSEFLSGACQFRREVGDFGGTHFSVDFEAIVLPHPSRANLWWNSAANVERARTVCRRAFRERVSSSVAV